MQGCAHHQLTQQVAFFVAEKPLRLGTIVLKEVPANVCDVCGEVFVEEEVSAAAREKAEEVVEAGAGFDVRRWKGAQKTTA